MASHLAHEAHLLTSTWFVATILESTLYAGYVVAFGISLYFLFNVRGRRVSPNVIFLSISVALFALVTLHFVLTVQRSYHCFVDESPEPLGTMLCFTTLGITEIVRLTSYACSLMLMDGLLAYRLWIIWGRNIWVTLFPALAVIAYFAGTVAQIYLAHDATFSEVVAGTTIGHLVTANYTLSLIVCIYTTALITWKILQNSRALRSVGIEHVLGPVIHIVVESAAVYSALTLFVLISYVLNKPILFVALNVIPPTVGINYSLILIRVGLGTAQGSRGAGPTPPAFEQISMSRRDLQGTASGSYPLKVNVTKHVEDDVDIEAGSADDVRKRGSVY